MVADVAQVSVVACSNNYLVFRYSADIAGCPPVTRILPWFVVSNQWKTEMLGELTPQYFGLTFRNRARGLSAFPSVH